MDNHEEWKSGISGDVLLYSFIFHGSSLVHAGKLVISTRHTDMEQPLTAQRAGMYFEHDSVVSNSTYKFRAGGTR